MIEQLSLLVLSSLDLILVVAQPPHAIVAPVETALQLPSL
jgi:hypothetical protein